MLAIGEFSRLTHLSVRTLRRYHEAGLLEPELVDASSGYGELGSWVVHNALTVAGPVRERYLVTPRDSEDPAAWRTEIGWPVFRVASTA